MDDITEKRQYFRVDLLEEVSASAKISSVNNQVIEFDKTIPVSLLNISAGGMRVRIGYNLPAMQIVLNLKFKFENENYDLPVQILRRSENNQYGLKYYLTSHDQRRMIRCLNMYKLNNIKFRKVELDFKAKKYIGCFINFLELIEEPAYLITEQRLVVAANLKAHENGVKLGERCYKTICKRKNICPYCLLEKSIFKKDQVIEIDAIVLDSDCLGRWLYTENGLIIHYFKK